MMIFQRTKITIRADEVFPYKCYQPFDFYFYEKHLCEEWTSKPIPRPFETYSLPIWEPDVLKTSVAMLSALQVHHAERGEST